MNSYGFLHGGIFVPISYPMESYEILRHPMESYEILWALHGGIIVPIS